MDIDELIAQVNAAEGKARFSAGVIGFMQERQLGLEDALQAFRQHLDVLDAKVGDIEFTAFLAEEFTLHAQWFRDQVQAARELVELADK